MATRNERKAKAKARHAELTVAVKQAFAKEAERQAAAAKRGEAISELQVESRPVKGIGPTRMTFARNVTPLQEAVPTKPGFITVKRGAEYIYIQRRETPTL